MTRGSIAHGEAPSEDAPGGGLSEALIGAASRFPDGGFHHIDAEGGAIAASYAETLARALRILGGLQRQGFRPGDFAILHLTHSADFVPACWAVLLGGGVVAPLARRPRSRRHARTAAGLLQRLNETLPAPWLITDAEEGGARRLDGAVLSQEGPGEAAPNGDPEATRLLIPTSGTTERPRLVALSERAALARWWPTVPAAEHALTHLTWSPFDHIMGLGLVSPNLERKIALAPERFAAAPTAWLDAIEQLAVTHATMTNSGLEMIASAARAAPERHWNLATLRKLGVGAEAISPRVCRRFFETLSPMGLRRDVMILGYGLSECGPVVGGADCFTPEAAASGPPSLDRPTRGHSVRIARDGAVLAEGEVGPVEVRGPTMTSGYYGDPEASAALFTADGWLRTGDLGFLRDERLTITGREKEQIIIHGVKYACAVIERVAEAVEGVSAAFAAPCLDRKTGGGHFAVFFVPVDGSIPAREITTKLHEAIAREFGLAPTAIAPIDAESLPRTPSGKVQRHELGAALDAGRYDSLLAPEPGTGVNAQSFDAREHRIAAIWSELLGERAFGLDDDFFTVGGDSIGAVRMVLAIEEAFDVQLPQTVLHDRTTIRGLAAWLATGAEGAGGAREPLARLEARLRDLTRTWDGEPVEPDGLVRGLNRDAPGRPWFWCMQYGQTMHGLQKVVGDQHPLYAMRSGQLIMDYTPANVTALARRYVREILAADPTGPYLVGGECQACYIALEIARLLKASGRPVALLVLLDTVFWDVFRDVPYDGRVACFAGTVSRFNPLRRFRAPEAGWRKLMTGGVQFSLVPADHFSFYDEPGLSQLAAGVRAATEAALLAPPVGPAPTGGVLSDAAYSFSIHTPPLIEVSAGAQVIVPLNLVNTSPVEWPADAGIGIGNHWLYPDGEVATWADGRGYLAQAIAPGATGFCELPLRAPALPGRYIVEFDLVEEGVTWFADKGARPAYVSVEVRPGRAGPG